MALSGQSAWKKDEVMSHQHLQRTVAMIGVDLSRPWTIQRSLETWIQVLTELLMKEINRLPPNDQSALLSRQANYLARCYDLSRAEGGVFTIKPLGGGAGRGRGNDDSDHLNEDSTTTPNQSLPQLAQGVLEVNLGVPIVVVGLKADAVKSETFEEEQASQYLQQYLRRFCLQHGASLVYASASSDANVLLLQRYLLHR